MNVRPREAADQAAAQAFLARHGSVRVARLGELLHSLDHPAVVAEAADGRLLGMLTYVPGRDWEECEILTLHAAEQWYGAARPWSKRSSNWRRAKDALACGSLPPTTTLVRCVFTSAAGFASSPCIAVPLIAAAPI
jgi:hypothetical protein